ncbi:MAG TPA: flavodoxin family protein [Methanoculleus sp.]|nr:flavodoxin family protein [Methanoculleus sp.]
MKILVIMGSPRKGNTYQAAQRIEEVMRSLGDVEFEYLMLRDVGLEPCRGCLTCFTWGEERCPVRDDAPAVGQKLSDADGVIFASPVYGLAVTGLMKTFIDRFSYLFAPGSSRKKPSSSPPPALLARKMSSTTSTPSRTYGAMMSSPASVSPRLPSPKSRRRRTANW